VFFAAPYLDALTLGDPSGAAYSRLVATLEPSARLEQLSAPARRSVASRLALVDLADAAAIAGIQVSGQLRLNGRQHELQLIEALERDVVDPSPEQSTTAVLDKISGAALLGARQRQARIQLLTEVLEQLLVDNKQVRDAEAAALNIPLVLSGHTHGGQVALLWLHRSLSLARLITPFVAGLYRAGRSYLYVNRGAGSVMPMVRLGARPEVTELTLVPADEARDDLALAPS